MAEPTFRKEFSEKGFWQKTEGMLVIATLDGEIAGHIEFFRPVPYWDAFELSYQLYDDRFAGRGYVTEAVQLLVDYLFGAKKEHRIHLVIVPENAASRRIAEKCGFTLEGTVRGAFFNDGRNQDVLLYSLLRTDPRPWQAAGPEAGDGRRVSGAVVLGLVGTDERMWPRMSGTSPAASNSTQPASRIRTPPPFWLMSWMGLPTTLREPSGAMKVVPAPFSIGIRVSAGMKVRFAWKVAEPSGELLQGPALGQGRASSRSRRARR